MKRLIGGCICLLLATVFLAIIPTEAESAIYEDTIRLHILANSDSDEDQRLKLKVRDEVLKSFSSELDELASKSDAEEKISILLENIKCFAQDVVICEGYTYKVDVTLSEEWYDTREYEDFTLPAGIYTSLRIIIGEGCGRNWWCVMFPPLCLDMATESAPQDDAIKKYSSEEISLISGRGYNVKFKLLEMFSNAFS